MENERAILTQLAAQSPTLLPSHLRRYVGYFSSPAVLECLEDLQARADSLAQAQFELGVMFPVTVEGSACPLVEAWARGEDWYAPERTVGADGPLCQRRPPKNQMPARRPIFDLRPFMPSLFVARQRLALQRHCPPAAMAAPSQPWQPPPQPWQPSRAHGYL